MPTALAIGVPYELFWHLNPNKLRSFMVAFEQKREFQDSQMWFMGQYIMSALNATVMNIVNKEKQKYVDKPFQQKSESVQQKELTEEEVIRQTQAIFAQLETKSNNEKRQKRFMEKQGEVE